ncbi:hypothetical protein AAC387_Pa07g0099 [Persea americana]
MAKVYSFFLFAAAACFLSTLAITNAAPDFIVQGRVYCDTCRAGFETNVTKYIEGAKVKVVCRNDTTGEMTYSGNGVTDSSGTYNLEVDNDHEEEICQVELVESPLKDCKEVREGMNRARVVLTNNMGIVSNIRYPNSLGFFKSTPLPGCHELLDSYFLEG